MAIRTYKYLLRPNKTQSELLEFILSQHRYIYNYALAQRKDIFEQTGQSISYVVQSKYFLDHRRNNPDSLGLTNSASVQQTLRKLDKAFSAFFRRVKKGDKKAGYPRFKGSERFSSMEYRYGDGCILKENEQHRMRLKVQNIGEIRMCYHRPIPTDAVIKHSVIKRVKNKWYVCLMMDIPDSKTVNTNERAVGIDVGIKCIAATSDGVIYGNPKWLREAQRELRVKQRKLSRRKLGSNRRSKAKQEVTKLHEKIANQRNDYLHKITRELVEQYGFIAIEDLSLAFMNRNRHLALSSYDAGLGMFRSYLEYKAADAGVQVVAVNPSCTSQVCSGCGCLIPKKLSVRTHRCSDCGLELDRDVNAAVNILTRAKQTLGQSVRDVTWAEFGSSVSREAVAL